MSHGADFKQGFEMLLEQFGGQINVYRAGNTSAPVATLRGMKGSAKGNSNKVTFQFPDVADIHVGDLLQQDGSRDLWEVYETEDKVIANTFINFTAWVHKHDGVIGRPVVHGTVVNIGGDNVGGVQIAGSHSQQTMKVTSSAVHKEIAALQKLCDGATDIDALVKEEIRLALARVDELAAREKSPGLFKTIMDKIGYVVTAVEASKIAIAAAPHLTALARCFQ